MEPEMATGAGYSFLGTGYSFLGTDRMITCVPSFPSLTDLQSNQMLISHSNQISLHRNSVTPTHPAQVDREIHETESTQYKNMPFSANLIAPGPKTGVPTEISVGVNRCPNQDSLHSGARNGDDITHSQSNSASYEAEEEQVIDERKQRRRLSNRESARRSRLRKQHRLNELSAQVVRLRAENEEILKKINITSQHYALVTEKNSLLRSEALDLSHKLQELQHKLNAQSHGVFRTMGIETRNCIAAHMISESATIAQSSWVPPDLWF